MHNSVYPCAPTPSARHTNATRWLDAPSRPRPPRRVVASCRRTPPYRRAPLRRNGPGTTNWLTALQVQVSRERRRGRRAPPRPPTALSRAGGCAAAPPQRPHDNGNGHRLVPLFAPRAVQVRLQRRVRRVDDRRILQRKARGVSR